MRIRSSPSITAEAMHAFFDAKVAGVRSSTENAPPPVFTDASLGCSMTDFLTLSVDDVIIAVRRLPDKQCDSDPLPTSMLREYVDMLAPFLVELFNRSLLQGVVPTVFKSAYITPLLKKLAGPRSRREQVVLADIESVSALEDAGKTCCASATQLPLRRRPNSRPLVCL